MGVLLGEGRKGLFHCGPGRELPLLPAREKHTHCTLLPESPLCTKFLYAAVLMSFRWSLALAELWRLALPSSQIPHTSSPFSHKCWPGILSRGHPASRPPRLLDSSPRRRKAIFSLLPVLKPLFCCLPPLLLLFTPHVSQGDCSPLLTTPRKAEMC